jgi:hypothetical protein
MRLTIMCGKYSTAEKVDIESRKSDVPIDLFRIYNICRVSVVHVRAFEN